MQTRAGRPNIRHTPTPPHPPAGLGPIPGPMQPRVPIAAQPPGPLPRRTCRPSPFIHPCGCHWRGDLCAPPPRPPQGLLTCTPPSAAAGGPGGPVRPGEPGPGLRAAGLQEQQRLQGHRHEAMGSESESRGGALAPPVAGRSYPGTRSRKLGTGSASTSPRAAAACSRAGLAPPALPRKGHAEP